MLKDFYHVLGILSFHTLSPPYSLEECPLTKELFYLAVLMGR